MIAKILLLANFLKEKGVSCGATQGQGNVLKTVMMEEYELMSSVLKLGGIIIWREGVDSIKMINCGRESPRRKILLQLLLVKGEAGDPEN